ncbi:MAG: biotin/lipoyl-binding protein, partial [Paracoccus sp. (in: a-proteobacteria)]|nr:biotin/lipoyl-binding protein [Paracoccus sp. (in: a-proteobacteria)]
MADRRTSWLWAGAAVLIVAVAALVWDRLSQPEVPAGLAQANGRIEATKINVAALSGGRVDRITVTEGDMVSAGQVLVQMDVVQPTAQRRQAEAQLRRAEIGVETARSLVAQAEAQRAAAAAAVKQAQAVADADVSSARSQVIDAHRRAICPRIAICRTGWARTCTPPCRYSRAPISLAACSAMTGPNANAA